MSLHFKKKHHQQANSSGTSSHSFEDEQYTKVIEGIKKVYNQKIKPIEVTYNFEG
jgi:EH domain-containing protein 3/EH domain-containing protein 1